MIDDICSTKHMGNPNSVEANELAAKSKELRRRVILELIRKQGEKGITAARIAELLMLPFNTISGRCSELKTMKLIEETGERRKTTAGGTSAVLRAIQFTCRIS